MLNELSVKIGGFSNTATKLAKKPSSKKSLQGNEKLMQKAFNRSSLNG